MDNKERMWQGRIYDPEDPVLKHEQDACLEKMYDYNHLRPSQRTEHETLLKEMLAECGENCWIEPPFYANWGGKNLHFKDYVYANFGFTCVDDIDIYVGNHVMFAPHVTITVASHPLDPTLRERGLQFNRPVVIEDNVWIGAHAVILAGVTIGQNSVIAAGSVVTKDIPSNTLAMGVPCKVKREINEKDKQFYYGDTLIDWDEVNTYFDK